MRYADIVEAETHRRLRPSIAAAGTEDRLDLPGITVGDEILFGKFKNRRAVVKGFTTDQHNQPVLRTNKGDQPLFKPRLRKLMDPKPG